MTTIRAHYDGKALVPDEPVDLALNQKVTLHIETNSELRSVEVASADVALRALDVLERMAEDANAPDADFSRDSVYGGTLDDPR